MSSAGLTPTTVTVEDTDNKKGWTSITSTYDGFGFLVARSTVMDDGSTTSETFFGPQRLSLTVTDTSANDADWATRTTEWNWLGEKTARTTNYDNGDQLIERFDAATGARIARVELDGNDDKNWTSLTTTYDATGTVRIGTEKVFDNGRIETLTFDADTGVRTGRTIVDGDDDKDWQSKTLTYDADTGKLTAREIVDDDGSRDTITYANGKKASQMLVDGAADTFEWATFEATYDASGRMALSEELRDDGDLIVQTYAAGKLLERITYDNSGDDPWHVERVAYDSTGDVVSTTYYDDSGNILLV